METKKVTTSDCPLCLEPSEGCVCGLSDLVIHGYHEQGDLCCIKAEQNIYHFVLVIDSDGITEIHNFIKSNLATMIVFNCSTFGIREAFESQVELSKKHATFILKKSGKPLE